MLQRLVEVGGILVVNCWSGLGWWFGFRLDPLMKGIGLLIMAGTNHPGSPHATVYEEMMGFLLDDGFTQTFEKW